MALTRTLPSAVPGKVISWTTAGAVIGVAAVASYEHAYDLVRAQAAQALAVELTAGHVPSVRAIRARLHVRQPRAQRARASLAALNEAQAGGLLNTRVRCPGFRRLPDWTA
jgi:hypothetical protein